MSRKYLPLIASLAALVFVSAASADPLGYRKACAPTTVQGHRLSVDVVEGHSSCAKAQAILKTFVALKPAYGKPRNVTASGETLSCEAWKKSSGAGWRFICRNKAFTNVYGGGRLFPSTDYLNK